MVTPELEIFIAKDLTPSFGEYQILLHYWLQINLRSGLDFSEDDQMTLQEAEEM